MKRITWLFVFAVAVVASKQATAAPIVWSSGDLDGTSPPNVISHSGDFTLAPTLNTPSSPLLASLTVKYGLWSAPNPDDYPGASVNVDVFLNGTFLNTLVMAPRTGYASPGPTFSTFTVTGLLLNGVNTILFAGNNANDGDYVIGQVDLTYDDSGDSGNAPGPAAPEPGTLALMTFGGLGLIAGKYRKRRKAAA